VLFEEHAVSHTMLWCCQKCPHNPQLLPGICTHPGRKGVDVCLCCSNHARVIMHHPVEDNTAGTAVSARRTGTQWLIQPGARATTGHDEGKRLSAASASQQACPASCSHMFQLSWVVQNTPVRPSEGPSKGHRVPRCQRVLRPKLSWCRVIVAVLVHTPKQIVAAHQSPKM